eukprot:SAG22_NODE_21_length_31784_cov_15.522897_13_plen_63_part_00
MVPTDLVQALGGSDDLVYVKRRSKWIMNKLDAVRDRQAAKCDANAMLAQNSPTRWMVNLFTY